MIRPEWNVENATSAIEDLHYDELVAMIEAISEPDTEDEVSAYYGELIERTLPGADVAELVLWPNEWFRDSKKNEIDLSSQEIANYLLAWTGVKILGSNEIELPEIPKSKLAAQERPGGR